VLGNPYSGPAVDAWAAGVIFYAMLTGTLPFAGRGTQRTLGQVAEGRWVLPSGVRVSRVGRAVLRGLMCREVGGRWSVEEARRVVGARSGGDGGEAEVVGRSEGQRKAGEEEGRRRRGLKRAETDQGVVRALGSLWWWLAEDDLLARLAADALVFFFPFSFIWPPFFLCRLVRRMGSRIACGVFG